MAGYYINTPTNQPTTTKNNTPNKKTQHSRIRYSYFSPFHTKKRINSDSSFLGN